MNPTALITGASRGIGRGIALELASHGWDLLLNFARNTAAARDTAEACHRAAADHHHTIRTTLCPADVGNPEGRRDLVDAVQASGSPPDLLVNNAGIAPDQRVDLLDASEASFDRLLAVNLKGPFLLTQAVARSMIARRTADRPAPRIVFISSISAYTASVNRGDYCVSKAGVSMLVKLFAARLAEHGIGVHEIRPGIIATDMTAGVQAKYDKLIADGLTPIRRWGTPADVGRAVAAIALNLLPFSTGECLNVDGGFHLRTL